jgi:hypothetical protein
MDVGKELKLGVELDKTEDEEVPITHSPHLSTEYLNL